MDVIGERFGVTGFADRAIKRADLIALATEKRDLMPRSCESWSALNGVAPLPARIEPLPPPAAKQAFMAAFRQLNEIRLHVAA